MAWEHIKIYFDISAGHWWIDGYSTHREINIYAVAPILRYYFTQSDGIAPYIDFSIGASYLTRTHIADRNLGVHFAFQDQVGVGMSIGKAQRFSMSLSAIHYSNCSLASINAGITMPLLLTIGYGF